MGGSGGCGVCRHRRRPGRCGERSRKEALGEDTASAACASLHVCYFQLGGEQAKFSNRLSWELKSSSPPPRCLQARRLRVCPGHLVLLRTPYSRPQLNAARSRSQWCCCPTS